jgi:Uma2 family endonuclease
MEKLIKEPAAKYNYITLNDYLACDMEAEDRFEYFDGEMVKMQGASLQHQNVVSNLVRHAGNALADKPCRIPASNRKVAPPSYRSFMYPDATITCGLPQLRTDYGDILLNPVVVFEVLRAPLKTPQTRLSDFLTTSLLIVNEGVIKSE